MSENKSIFRNEGRSNLIPFILVTSLFFMWGLANNMTDTLLAAFKKIMSMSDFQTSLIQIAFYGSYFCFALPAALFIKKKSYKAGILLGLLLYAVGCFMFFPAGKMASYGFYLFSIYVLAGGCSILETAANPYILSMGSEETATRRLNIAQAFNPIGSISGILLSQFFILSELNSATATERSLMTAAQLQGIQTGELNNVTSTYLFLGIILAILLVFVFFIKMPKVVDSQKDFSQDNLKNTFSRLLENKRYYLGVVAQFFYVGAQIGVWSFTIRYAMVHLNLDEKSAATVYLISMIGFTTARFVFAGLMKFIKPSMLLTISAVAATVSSAVVVLAGGMIGVIALVCVSVFMSLMFPTIYGMAMHKMDDNDKKMGGSGLIMAILGGAAITAAQGFVSDVTKSINISYIIPMACFVVVAAYAFWVTKLKDI